MSNGVRWTSEQLAAFRRRVDSAKRDISPAAAAGLARIERAPESKIERRLAQQIVDANIPIPPQRNYFFMAERDFEFDFAWPSRKVAVEVQGMAHRIKGKFQRDIEKRALAQLAGWRVLEVDGSAIRDGRAMNWLKQLLGV